MLEGSLGSKKKIWNSRALKIFIERELSFIVL